MNLLTLAIFSALAIHQVFSKPIGKDGSAQPATQLGTLSSTTSHPISSSESTILPVVEVTSISEPEKGSKLFLAFLLFLGVLGFGSLLGVAFSDQMSFFGETVSIQRGTKRVSNKGAWIDIRQTRNITILAILFVVAAQPAFAKPIPKDLSLTKDDQGPAQPTTPIVTMSSTTSHPVSSSEANNLPVVEVTSISEPEKESKLFLAFLLFWGVLAFGSLLAFTISDRMSVAFEETVRIQRGAKRVSHIYQDID